MPAPLASWPMPAAWAGLGALAVWGFWQTGLRHGDYTLAVVGTDFIPASELAFQAWFLVWGLAAMWALVRFLLASGLASVLAAGAERGLATRAPLWVGLGGLSATVLALTFHVGVTRGLPLSDDEHVYAFVAKTLLHGRLVNPLPSPPELFGNIFTVLNGRGWFGKYPIGHPLLLALGESVGLRILVVPLLAGLNVVLTYRVGRHMFDARTALAGALLLVVSPHFIMTHGTQLSQPASTTCMLLATLAWLRSGGRDRRFLVLAGMCAALGIVVRPMPGVLFAAVFALALLGQRTSGQRTSGHSTTSHTTSSGPEPHGTALARALPELTLFSLVAVLGVGVVYWVNAAQSGAGLASGYHLSGTEAGVAPKLFFAGKPGAWASSLGGAAWRQAFWFLGFPMSGLAVLWAWPQRGRTLFWGVFIALLLYRIAVPKTFMSVTGPIYMTEGLPFLALGTLDGLRRLSSRLLPQRAPAAAVVAVVGAGVIVSASMFLPVQLRALRTATHLRGRVYDGLAEAGANRALVFADHLVTPDSRRAWAYFPPSPSPDLGDDILFVRIPAGDGHAAARAAHAFWQATMPERRAFVFLPGKASAPLTELHAVSDRAPR